MYSNMEYFVAACVIIIIYLVLSIINIWREEIESKHQFF